MGWSFVACASESPVKAPMMKGKVWHSPRRDTSISFSSSERFHDQASIRVTKCGRAGCVSQRHGLGTGIEYPAGKVMYLEADVRDQKDEIAAALADVRTE